MWGSADVSCMRGLHTYEAAHRRWATAPQWRGDPKDESQDRKVRVNSSKRNWALRKKADGSIACRYHQTDVVTHHPDGRVTLEPWASLSTDAFANEVLPAGIHANFNNSNGRLVKCGERIYDIGGADTTTFELNMSGWYPTRETRPFELFTVNKQLAAAARKKHPLRDFKRFTLAAVALKPPTERWGYGNTYQASSMFELFVRGREHWLELLERGASWPNADERRVSFGRGICNVYNRDTGRWDRIEPLTPFEQGARYADRVYRRLLLAVYQIEDCVDVTKLPCLDGGWAQLVYVVQQQRIHGGGHRWSRWS